MNITFLLMGISLFVFIIGAVCLFIGTTRDDARIEKIGLWILAILVLGILTALSGILIWAELTGGLEQ